jgi:hypothetical protein
MRLLMPPIVIAVSFFLGLQPILKPVSAEDSTNTSQPAPMVWMDQHPEYNAVFDELHKSGAASVSIGRWPRKRFFSDMPTSVFEPLQIACGMAKFVCYFPHRLGAMDLVPLAAPMLSDYSRLMELDEALFGHDEDCTVELWESRSLMKNLELLTRLHEVHKLTVYTKRTDAKFSVAVRKVKVSGGLRLLDPAERAKKSGFVMGTVVDLNGKPVPWATVMIYARNGEPISGTCANDDGIFWDIHIRNVPYRMEAFAPPSHGADKVASSQPVNAESGEKEVRLVIDRVRLVPKPPDFYLIEDDDGKRIVISQPKSNPPDAR